MTFDIDQLLKDMGIDSGDLMLRHQGYEEGQSGSENLGRPVFNYLPLEVGSRGHRTGRPASNCPWDLWRCYCCRCSTFQICL